jgi:putative transposase
VKGRKRHLAVDVTGMVLGVLVLAANFSDDFGAKQLLQRIPFVTRWRWFLFDAGYDRPPLLAWCQQIFGVGIEITQRLATGFNVIPKRWVVERTLAWLGRSRRLSKDYEALPHMSETMIYLAMTRLMLKRLHPK